MQLTRRWPHRAYSEARVAWLENEAAATPVNSEGSRVEGAWSLFVLFVAVYSPQRGKKKCTKVVFPAGAVSYMHGLGRIRDAGMQLRVYKMRWSRETNECP